MKLMTVLALASGFVAAPLIGAGSASALPATCDGVDCVPGVVRNATQGQPCISATRYPFGIDPTSGATLICAQVGRWVATSPLFGVPDAHRSLLWSRRHGPGTRRIAAVLQRHSLGHGLQQDLLHPVDGVRHQLRAGEKC